MSAYTPTGFEVVDLAPFVDGDDDKIQAYRERWAAIDAAHAAYTKAR